MANGKRPVSAEVRREVARRLGCEIGKEIQVTCRYCGHPGYLEWRVGISGRGKGQVVTSFEFDHQIPEAKGGHSGPSNIVLACRRCNRSKGPKAISEWNQ